MAELYKTSCKDHQNSNYPTQRIYLNIYKRARGPEDQAEASDKKNTKGVKPIGPIISKSIDIHKGEGKHTKRELKRREF